MEGSQDGLHKSPPREHRGLFRWSRSLDRIVRALNSPRAEMTLLPSKSLRQGSLAPLLRGLEQVEIALIVILHWLPLQPSISNKLGKQNDSDQQRWISKLIQHCSRRVSEHPATVVISCRGHLTTRVPGEARQLPKP